MIIGLLAPQGCCYLEYGEDDALSLFCYVYELADEHDQFITIVTSVGGAIFMLPFFVIGHIRCSRIITAAAITAAAVMFTFSFSFLLWCFDAAFV